MRQGGTGSIWYAAILLTVFLWGMSFLWSDSVLDQGVPVFTFIFTRMVIAATALMLFSVLTGKFVGKIDEQLQVLVEEIGCL